MIQGVRHIRAFLAVARLGSFTKAADALHVSQPALTVQIRQLEEALGVRLLDRSKRSVGLTEVGRSLLGPLERVLLDLDDVLARSRDLAGCRRGSVTVAALPSVAAGLLPAAIRALREHHPGIEVHVRDVVGERIVQMVKSEEADFGIGSQLGADRELTLDELFVDGMCAYAPAGHALAGSADTTLAALTAFPLILTARDSSVRRLVEQALDTAGLTMELAGEANYMSTAIGMVRAGLGVAILPESAADSAPCAGLVCVPIADPGLRRRIGLVRKIGRTLSPAAGQLAEELLRLSAAVTGVDQGTR